MILALCGFANSGKSTVADRLVQSHGFRRYSFAGPVKDVVATTFGWPREQLEGNTAESREWRNLPDQHWTAVLGHTVTPRLALQMIGNGFRQLLGDNIWVSRTIQAINSRSNNTNVVVDDLRYRNEWNALAGIGASTYIIRPKNFASSEHLRLWNAGFARRLPGAIPLHSALHISDWDWLLHPSMITTPVITNCGTIEDLYRTTDRLYTEHSN